MLSLSDDVHRVTEVIGGSAMHLSRVAVSGLRASAETPMSCDLPGRFNVLIGANGAGKTTLTDALYRAHTSGAGERARTDMKESRARRTAKG